MGLKNFKINLRLAFRYFESKISYLRFAIWDLQNESWYKWLAISTCSKTCCIKLTKTCTETFTFLDYSANCIFWVGLSSAVWLNPTTYITNKCFQRFMFIFILYYDRLLNQCHIVDLVAWGRMTIEGQKIRYPLLRKTIEVINYPCLYLLVDIQNTRCGNFVKRKIRCPPSS